jgi:hypothetical protein
MAGVLARMGGASGGIRTGQLAAAAGFRRLHAHGVTMSNSGSAVPQLTFRAVVLAIMLAVLAATERLACSRA